RIQFLQENTTTNPHVTLSDRLYIGYRDEVARAEAEARKISRNLRDVSRNLAGSGDFREILQRLESIVELQGKVISETRDAAGTEDSTPQKGSGGKKDK
ncbi:MAG: hypothetical protein MK133_16075, partial [Planctomycetes bacterium]|nr:hypothetical protein [Planctomycetota bacterium]